MRGFHHLNMPQFKSSDVVDFAQQILSNSRNPKKEGEYFLGASH
jgi:hypothetical protein